MANMRTSEFLGTWYTQYVSKSFAEKYSLGDCVMVEINDNLEID